MDRHVMAVSYISSCEKQFTYYKQLAEKATAQLTDEMFFSTSNTHNISEEHNSIAVLYKHISGNMKSRWTDFYTTDGEKEWRDRDNEFIDENWTREQVVNYWEDSWKLLFSVINDLDEEKLERTIYIRNMGHTVVEALNRQMMHYAYHIGQIVLLSKQWRGDEWTSLSIPRNSSRDYNESKFSKPKRDEHFTDDL